MNLLYHSVLTTTTRSRTLHCPSCGTDTCSTCKAAVANATEHVCERKAEDLGYTKQNRCKSCPSCHTLIQLVDACNHIMCTVCRHQFCFVCLRSFKETAIDGNHKCPSYGDPKYNKDGYGADGFHRDTGLDREGYDRSGFNIHDLNRDGERKPVARKSTRLSREQMPLGPPEGVYEIRTPRGPLGEPHHRRHRRMAEDTRVRVEQHNAAQFEAVRQGLTQRRGALSGPAAQERPAALLQAVQAQLQHDLNQTNAELVASPNPVFYQAGAPALAGSSAVHIPPAPQATSGGSERRPPGRPSPQTLYEGYERMHGQYPALRTAPWAPTRRMAMAPYPLRAPVVRTPESPVGTTYPPFAPFVHGEPPLQPRAQPQDSVQNTSGPFQHNLQALPTVVNGSPVTWQPMPQLSYGAYAPNADMPPQAQAVIPLGSTWLQQPRGLMLSQPGLMPGVVVPHSLRHHRAPVLSMPALSTPALSTHALATPDFSTSALGTRDLGVPPLPMQQQYRQPDMPTGQGGPGSVAMESLRQFQDEWPAFLSRP